MKQKWNSYAIAAFLIFLILIAHCSDLERKAAIKHPTDYHFDVDDTGYTIFSEDMKVVGRLHYGDNPTLDSLIDKDNQ